ncbi:hypothetical protein Hanom_Chr14g01275481 [Helianthus anomalus]
MTVGSRSTNTALGTCLPELVSLKKVLKESSVDPVLSLQTHHHNLSSIKLKIHISYHWRSQKLFAGGADEVFNHIFKGAIGFFCLKYTLIFFFKGCGRPPWPKGDFTKT